MVRELPRRAGHICKRSDCRQLAFLTGQYVAGEDVGKKMLLEKVIDNR
jgi:hypothetical protein